VTKWSTWKAKYLFLRSVKEGLINSIFKLGIVRKCMIFLAADCGKMGYSEAS